jgi:hypothetical protein
LVHLKPNRVGLYWYVSSLRLGGVRFVVYPQDHRPRHVHCLMGGIEVVVDLREGGTVALADRQDAVRPGNAKRSDVRRILRKAAENFDELVKLWEKVHAEEST